MIKNIIALAMVSSMASFPVFSASAIFAGGCFWCTEADFEKLEGVISAESGYTGGHVENPTYKQVVRENTGHYEAVRVVYDESKLSYQDLLDYFWPTIDPLDGRGQFCDKGDSYRSAIFAATAEEKSLAEASSKKIEAKLGESVQTRILDAAVFYPAEDYHQDYYKKNPYRYNYYRWSCGREKRLEKLWGKKD